MSGSAREMPKYQCHKIVWALKIKKVDPIEFGKAIITPEEDGYAPFEVGNDFVFKHAPKAGGYYVVYEDGYKSFSPAVAFDEGYIRLNAVSDKEKEAYRALNALRLAKATKYVDLDKDVIEPLRRTAIDFYKDFNKMSVVDKVSCHPPVGSGGGPGLYVRPMEDIFNEWFKNRVTPV